MKKVACIQMNSQENKKHNLNTALSLLSSAHSQGVQWATLPEVFTYRGNKDALLENAEAISGPSISALQKFAKDHTMAILAGSICETIPNERKVYNTSVLIGNNGEIIETYRKIHLFDAVVDKKQVSESEMYESGDKPKMALLSDVSIGLSICYDLRFPELYRYYAKNGAEVLTIPASFTTPTGKAHWEVLLRARAIENQAFVIAPNQVGPGARDISTYGNSMIIDPWGEILARGSDKKEEVIVAEIDLDKQKKLKSTFPSLTKRRFFIKE